MKDAKLYKILRPIFTFIIKCFFRVEIINEDNLLKNESLILCGNHTNWLDPLLVGSATKRNVYFLAKSELFKGLKKYFFKSVGCISVDRSRKNPDAISESVNLLNNNKIICIFPEGTINKTKDIIMPFKFGAVSMASKTNSYIVPFSITGKYKIFKESIIIEFGEPYKIKTNLEKENDILMNKVKRLIIKNRGNNE